MFTPVSLVRKVAKMNTQKSKTFPKQQVQLRTFDLYPKICKKRVVITHFWGLIGLISTLIGNHLPVV